MSSQQDSVFQRIRLLLTRFARAVKLVFSTSPAWSTVGLITVALRGAVPLLIVYLTKLIVDSVSENIGLQDLAEAVKIIGPLVGLALAVSVLSAGLGALNSFSQTSIIEALGIRMNDDMHAKAVEADLGSYESSFYQDKLFRTQQEIGYRPMTLIQNLVDVTKNTICLTAVVGLVFSFNAIVATALLASCLPSALVRITFGRRNHRWAKQRTWLERMAYYLRWMMTVSLYAKEVRIYGLAPNFREKFRNIRGQLGREKIAMVGKRSAAEFMASLFAACVFYGAFGLIIYNAITGVLTIGALVMYYGAFQFAQLYFKDMMTNVAELYEDNLFLANYFEFMDHPTTVKEPKQPEPFPTLGSGLTVEDVWFRYPGSDIDVLQGVSMRLQPGQVTALVGQNGSGKTTLVKLLCRFYDPTVGRVTLNGTDLRDLRLTALRSNIGVVFQDYSMYPFSAAENIAFGAIELPVSQRRIAECAKMVAVDEVIEGLPQGYHTVLSKWFEGGRELSAGQWQKVAIARFLYKSGPIALLDEPTNMLDSKSESLFLESVKDLAKNRVILVISHRLATVEAAHNVYVLERGRIVESGDPADLMKRKGACSRLFRSTGSASD